MLKMELECSGSFKTMTLISSIDLFFYEDGCFGIFEYCNQSGVCGVPSKVVYSLHLYYVKNTIVKAFKGK